jgi:hypothetical protein
MKAVRRRISTPARLSDDGRPKTRASPCVGRAMPSSTLIVVVLPAPFLPRKPKIDPSGTRRSSPRSASTSS